MEKRTRSVWLRVLPSLMRAVHTFREEMRKASAAFAEQRLAKRDVSIMISGRWVRLCRSPFAIIPTAFSGVSVSFAPLFLYMYGQGMTPLGPEPLGLVLCWLMILVPGFFYIRLGHHVLDWVRNAPAGPSRGGA